MWAKAGISSADNTTRRAPNRRDAIPSELPDRPLLHTGTCANSGAHT